MRRAWVLVSVLGACAAAQGCSAELLALLSPTAKRPSFAAASPSPQAGANLPTLGRPSTSPSALGPLPSVAPAPQPGAGATTAPGASAAPLPQASAVPVGQRSTVDRPDEVEGHQIHALYVIPADSPDEALDTQGTIERALAAMNRWLQGQAQAAFRLDTYQGRPDVSFVRLPFKEAEAREADGKVAQDRIIEAVANAGFLAPHKTYALWYGGPADRGESCDANGGATTGRGGGGYAALYLKACTSNPPGGDAEGQAGASELTIAHEIIHALGHVPDCAPHAGQGGHTTDNPKDLMAPSGVDPAETELDPGRDDYYGHGRPGCLDLAKSTFWAPLPAGAVPPLDRPMVLGLPAGASALALGSAGPGGELSLEGALVARMQADRQAAGMAPLPTPAELLAAARRMAEATALGQEVDLESATATSGYSAPVAANFLQSSRTTLGASELLEGFKAPLPWLDPSVAELGVAVVVKGGKLGFALASGKGQARLSEVRVAPGPLQTRSLSLRVQLAPKTPAGRIHLKLDDEFYIPSWTVEAGSAVEAIASVPPGKHTLSLLLQSGKAYQRSAGSLPVVATLEVDGSAASGGLVLR